jgi:uncharacterized damage-inducible protein DinB
LLAVAREEIRRAEAATDAMLAAQAEAIDWYAMAGESVTLAAEAALDEARADAERERRDEMGRGITPPDEGDLGIWAAE